MKSYCVTVKMKMIAIDQYNPERLVVIKIVKIVIELWNCFSFFVAFLGVKDQVPCKVGM